NFLCWVIIAPGQVFAIYISRATPAFVICPQTNYTGNNLPIPYHFLVILISYPPEVGQIGEQPVRSAIAIQLAKFPVRLGSYGPPVGIVVAKMDSFMRVGQIRRGGIEQRTRCKKLNPSFQRQCRAQRGPSCIAISLAVFDR